MEKSVLARQEYCPIPGKREKHNISRYKLVCLDFRMKLLAVHMIFSSLF